MSEQFIIQGGKRLMGKVQVSGSKNAALPILCAALLAKTPSTFENVPDIEDVRSLIKIMEGLGVAIEKQGNRITINPANFKNGEPDPTLVEKMRASILMAPPLLIRHGKLQMCFPGGCVLGKRPIQTHLYVFKKFGVQITEQEKRLEGMHEAKRSALFKIKKEKMDISHSFTIVMPEASVTATENAIMFSAARKGKTEIHLAACEPHVQDLCEVLQKMGARIQGIGSHTLIIEGTENLQGVQHEIMGDYLEVGTFALAAAMTKGEVQITRFPMHHLDILWQKFEEAGIDFILEKNQIFIKPSEKINPISMLKTAVHPSFPTDLQAPFAVLMTQAEGISKIFETLFEGRLSYLFELEKMGARIEMINPHQAIIIGPTKLKGTSIASCDIRAGAAMVLAGLIAEGQTTINNIAYIHRGYENFDKKLAALGADISNS